VGYVVIVLIKWVKLADFGFRKVGVGRGVLRFWEG